MRVHSSCWAHCPSHSRTSLDRIKRPAMLLSCDRQPRPPWLPGCRLAAEACQLCFDVCCMPGKALPAPAYNSLPAGLLTVC
jgi:hypothetical protein